MVNNTYTIVYVSLDLGQMLFEVTLVHTYEIEGHTYLLLL